MVSLAGSGWVRRAHDDVEGSGIGLASVRRILTAQGGTIGVGDAEGGGAVVWVELPDPWVRNPQFRGQRADCAPTLS